MKKLLFFVVLCIPFLGYGQKSGGKYRSKKVAVSDSILVDTVALNSSNLRVKDMQGNTIDPLLYSVDYPNALVFPLENLMARNDSLRIDYLVFPEFLTKEYFEFDQKIIVENTGSMEKLYSLDQSSN